MLRPDRLPVGLSKYINKYLTLNLPEQVEFNLSDVLADSKCHLGVLLLLPENLSCMKSHPVTRLKLTTSPVDVLFGLAKVCYRARYQKCSVGLGLFFYPSVSAHVLCAQKNPLIETVLLSTLYICFD